jgi:hypothetical protein
MRFKKSAASVRVDRRVTRMLAGLTAVVTAVVGLSLVTASPATAATGAWTPYGNTNPISSSNSTWGCARSKALTTNVVAQVCAIRAPGGDAVQAAVIVRNSRSSLYSVSATADLWDEFGELDTWECGSSGVGANSWSVCFGRTVADSLLVNSQGSANGVDLGLSSTV